MRVQCGMVSSTIRRLVLLAAVSFTGVAVGQAGAAANGKVGSDCTFKGRKLYGKIKVVTSFPDLKVQIVKSFPDLKVQRVTDFPDRCGKWKTVDAFPDLKVQFVDAFPDLKIQFVDAFPGLP